MVWYSQLFQNFPQFIVIHTVKGFHIVNKAEIGVFLELSCFFDDPADVGNLISGCSAFSKTSLNIWKFTVHILLKPGLENSLVAQRLKRLPPMQETWVRSLGQEDSPGEGNGNPLQCLAWRSPVDYSARGRKESDTTERLHFHFS